MNSNDERNLKYINRGFELLAQYNYVLNEIAPMRGLLILDELIRIERSFYGMPDTSETHHFMKLRFTSYLQCQEDKLYVRRR